MNNFCSYLDATDIWCFWWRLRVEFVELHALKGLLSLFAHIFYCFLSSLSGLQGSFRMQNSVIQSTAHNIYISFILAWLYVTSRLAFFAARTCSLTYSWDIKPKELRQLFNRHELAIELYIQLHLLWTHPFVLQIRLPLQSVYPQIPEIHAQKSI